MKEHNKLNKIWWTLFITGALSASVGTRAVYAIVYKRAYDKAYREAYERGFEKRGYKHEIWNMYGGDCIDFGLLDESEKAASQIATQKAKNTAAFPFVLGVAMLSAGVGGLVENKRGRERS